MRGPAVAYVFPGQGSQREGMRAAVEDACPDLLELARRLVGDDPFERARDGTRWLQPAIYLASVAAWLELGEPEPDYLAGHSLGELAALVAARSVTPEEGLRIVVVRARAMQEADDAAAEPGGMLAVGVPRSHAERLAERHGVHVANDNAPDQAVLSGARSALVAARAEAKANGIRSVMLAVNGALHSPAMRPAAPSLERALAGVHVRPPRAPVFSGLTASPFDDIRARLVAGMSATVRWREVLLRMRELGVARFVEVGPGDVLTGLIRRTLPDVEVVTAAKLVTGRA